MQAMLVLEVFTDDEVMARLRWSRPEQGGPPPWTPGLVRRADRAARAMLGRMELVEEGPTRRYRRPEASGSIRALCPPAHRALQRVAA
ncbi:MAG TPA: hypothetical protein ENK18_13870 [Deltaproteobacteria bacterium]|nr:hypothetical protein [Deltaproteobacteria bacterium]